MALTTDRICELWENYSPTKGIESFARAIEAEVRKHEDALIRQLLDALEQSSPHTDVTCAWKPGDFAIRRSAAAAAAKARLGEET